MHKTIILWTSSIIITFLAGYIYNITDWTYPISGTIGVDGKKVSFMFDKIHYGNNPYELILRTDVADLKGKVKWRNKNETEYWYEADLISEEKILRAEIPYQQPPKQIEYKVQLNYNDKEYNLPKEGEITLTFYSKVPVPVKFFNGLLIYLILFLAVRVMLESFNINQKIKKYSFVTVVAVLLFTALIHPLYLSYKFGYINHAVPPLENLFPLYAILFLTVWIAFTIIHFKAKNPKPYAGTAGLLTLAIYLFIRF